MNKKLKIEEVCRVSNNQMTVKEYRKAGNAKTDKENKIVVTAETETRKTPEKKRNRAAKAFSKENRARQKAEQAQNNKDIKECYDEIYRNI